MQTKPRLDDVIKPGHKKGALSKMYFTLDPSLAHRREQYARKQIYQFVMMLSARRGGGQLRGGLRRCGRPWSAVPRGAPARGAGVSPAARRSSSAAFGAPPQRCDSREKLRKKRRRD
ncbi:unnamed protein product [Boreogadus saida]